LNGQSGRLGELMDQQRKAGKLAKGGGDQRSKHRVKSKPGDKTTLSNAGIDKNLAHRAALSALALTLLIWDRGRR
jgi:hypothetical protein